MGCQDRRRLSLFAGGTGAPARPERLVRITIWFWIEVGQASPGDVLSIVTFFWKDWIEIVFHVDPDRDSGELEWVVSIAFLVAGLLFAVLARMEWRRLSLRQEGSSS